MSAAVARLLRARIQSNALKRKPATRAGVMITGGGYQGKTETACEIAAAFEDEWLALHGQLNPDAMRGHPGPARPGRLRPDPGHRDPEEHLPGDPGLLRRADHKSWTLPQLVRAVRESLHDHGTKVLLSTTSPGCGCTARTTRTPWT